MDKLIAEQLQSAAVCAGGRRHRCLRQARFRLLAIRITVPLVIRANVSIILGSNPHFLFKL